MHVNQYVNQLSVDEPFIPPRWFPFQFDWVSCRVSSDTTVSNILLQSGDIEIGLMSLYEVGVCVFGIGITISFFQIFGHLVLIKHWLYITVNGIASWSDNLFTNFFGMSPGTELEGFLSFFILRATSPSISWGISAVALVDLGMLHFSRGPDSFVISVK